MIESRREILLRRAKENGLLHLTMREAGELNKENGDRAIWSRHAEASPCTKYN